MKLTRENAKEMSGLLPDPSSVWDAAIQLLDDLITIGDKA